MAMRVPFDLTDHARRRIDQRGIKMRWLEQAIARPDRVEVDRDDPELLLAYKRIHEAADRTLCVVYNQTVARLRVVTVFFEE